MMQKHLTPTGSPVASSAPNGPKVIVVAAVHRPDEVHLQEQFDSIAAQSHTNLRLVAVIADTVSGPLCRAAAFQAGLDDAIIVPSDVHLDPVRAFERGIAEALRLIEATGEEALIALADQDDIWHPDRLARGVERLANTSAQLAHSDARLVAADGRTELHPSVFRFEKRQKSVGLRDLLYRNTVTGMTLIMRPGLAALALPFPQQSGVHFYHDLWLALLAEATGGVSLIDTPLVDYRQHSNNAVGAADPRVRRVSALRGRAWIRQKATSYALARYLAQSVTHRLVEAASGGRLSLDEMVQVRLRPFHRRLRGAEAHLGDAVRLLLRGHVGPARIATGFAVVSLGRSAWALRQALGAGVNSAIESFDTRLFSLSPGVSPRPAGITTLADKPKTQTSNWVRLVDRRKQPSWTPSFTAEDPAFVVLVPTLNPTEIFAGVATALDIGLGMARRGMRVRFVATDLQISSYAASQSFLFNRCAGDVSLADIAGRVELQCGVTSASLPAHRGDIFLATAWWTAHVADELIRSHGYVHRRFQYLIQDFEPNFYPWGPEFADAMASYSLDFDAVFNTTLLRDHFRAQGFAFAGARAMAFHPSIDIGRYAGGARPDLVQGTPRRLALYGRPEVPRNMYATAIEALGRFLQAESIHPSAIELVSVGLAHAPVALPGGHQLNSLGKLPWDDYPDFLLKTEIGLSLMYSPHPSHPPIEMAASGVRVVTNRFGPKDLSRLSAAIESVEGTAPALADALARAWRAPPVQPEARHIDLTALGMPFEKLLDRLSRRTRPLLARTGGDL